MKQFLRRLTRTLWQTGQYLLPFLAMVSLKVAAAGIGGLLWHYVTWGVVAVLLLVGCLLYFIRHAQAWFEAVERLPFRWRDDFSPSATQRSRKCAIWAGVIPAVILGGIVICSAKQDRWTSTFGVAGASYLAGYILGATACLFYRYAVQLRRVLQTDDPHWYLPYQYPCYKKALCGSQSAEGSLHHSIDRAD